MVLPLCHSLLLVHVGVCVRGEEQEEPQLVLPFSSLPRLYGATPVDGSGGGGERGSERSGTYPTPQNPDSPKNLHLHLNVHQCTGGTSDTGERGRADARGGPTGCGATRKHPGGGWKKVHH
ncbi:hypothetical protein NDU88_002476 [Pleurodeles waltl]|uniref:Secreted protein n=1 Tax=Pleurodeles waltl TaxID=8319 RepID=A0AAV7UX67_PLEWA|nr:hypothetical protein NDU88_002476 [Pleurodeles waltl]